jgi:serine/threonine protein kinase
MGTPEEPAIEFHPGERIGSYLVERRVGVGGMGAVYHALHDDRGAVALKIMHVEQLECESSTERMAREASILRALGHAGLPQFFETGVFEGRPWIAMELVEGEQLAMRLAQGPMAADEVLDLIAHVAQVLAAAHAIGVTHRDLKPDNIFVACGRFPVRVIDWGIAHRANGERYTSVNEAIGTPTYMAPEQARGAPTDGRADVYGLGVVAYRALSGRAPFTGGTPIEILVQHLNKPPPSLGPRCPEAPMGLVDLVERMLIKSVDDRPTAADVCSAIDRMCEPIVDAPTQQLRIKRA